MKFVHWGLFLGAVVLSGALAHILLFSSADLSDREKVSLHITSDVITVWTATNQAQWQQGLSGTKKEALGANGMLFLFPEKKVQHFWMRKMRYDLDVVWIAEGRIVKISEQVPAPSSQNRDIARMDSDPFLVEWVLEVPAGMVAEHAWKVGDVISLTGTL